MNLDSSVKKNTTSRLSFHEGNALLSTAATYPTLQGAILEACQNSIDANATNISVNINKRKRYIYMEDNGDGVSLEMEEALQSVHQTLKGKGKMGRFGRGLITPLGKCERFYFISTSKDNPKSYRKWEFETEKIRSQSKGVEIPVSLMPELIFSPSTRKEDNKVSWRTKVKIVNYTEDRIINKLSLLSIKNEILDRFGLDLARKNIKVKITIAVTNENGDTQEDTFSAKGFSGAKLEEVVIDNADAGEVLFSLYIAAKTKEGRKGKIFFGEKDDGFRISLANFLRNANELLKPEIIEVLRSGSIEGEILASKVSLNPDRINFENDEAFFGLCVAIEEWYEKHGSLHYKEIEERHKDERYQNLTVKSLKVIEGLIKCSPELQDLIKTFKKGSIGLHHLAKKDCGKTEPAISIYGSAGEPKETNGTSAPRNPKTEHERHMPLTATGPKGHRRAVVRHNSLGLQISHDILRASTTLWEFEPALGLLTINIKHPSWVACEGNDNLLMKFQEYLIMTVLNLYAMPEDWREAQKLFVDELIKSYVFLLLHADALTGRRPGRKKNE